MRFSMQLATADVVAPWVKMGALPRDLPRR
jgi:hypothetical protein